MTLTYVHTPSGKVAHLAPLVWIRGSALCGVRPTANGWSLSDNQLPLCQKCAVEKQRTEGRERERASRRGHE